MNNDIIMKKGKAVELQCSLAAVPLGVEYESLMKNLRDNVIQRYENNPVDMRKRNDATLTDFKNNDCTKTMILLPGLFTPGFDSPNTKPAYPQSDIPHSQGQIWSD